MQLTDHIVKIKYLQYTQFLIKKNIYVNTLFSGQGLELLKTVLMQKHIFLI